MKYRTVHCSARVAAAILFSGASIASAQQEVVLPPLQTNIQAVFTPKSSRAGSWDLDATGFRSASPTENIEAYGYGSTASAGWEGFVFGAWSDDPASLDPIYDPNIENVLQTPEVWEALSFFTTNPYGYSVQELELDVSLCIDDGCDTPLPNAIAYDPSGAYAVMDEVSISASSKTKIIRSAKAGSGVAGIAMVTSLRQQGKTDAEIDLAYPSLLEPAIQYITPPTTFNAYMNPVIYTVFDDSGVVLTGEELVEFLQSKGAPEQVIYNIINSLPFSTSANYSSTPPSEGNSFDYRNIHVTIELSGGIAGETGFPNNSVSAHGEFRITMEGALGDIEDGGVKAAEKAGEMVRAAVDKVNKNVQDKANGGGGTASPPVSVKVVIAAARIANWFSGLF